MGERNPASNHPAVWPPGTWVAWVLSGSQDRPSGAAGVRGFVLWGLRSVCTTRLQLAAMCSAAASESLDKLTHT